MLGKIMGLSRWSWAAFGKHPAARDYFQINLASPLVVAFSQWVENGFNRVPEDQKRTRVCSWRFWSRGQKKGTLLCGLGKSSSDSIGRPYPMMVLGEGTMAQWEKYWHLLPFGLGPTWDRMEYVATRHQPDLQQLENEINYLAKPWDDWEGIRNRRRQHEDMDNLNLSKKIIMSDISEKARSLESEQKLMISLNGETADDPFQMAGAWHLGINRQFSGIPSTVFMGGTTENTYLVLFSRPLSSEDFLSLWTV